MKVIGGNYEHDLTMGQCHPCSCVPHAPTRRTARPRVRETITDKQRTSVDIIFFMNPTGVDYKGILYSHKYFQANCP